MASGRHIRSPLPDAARVRDPGAARTPLVPDAPLTPTSEQAARAAVIVGARHVVPPRFEHRGHFTEDGATPAKAFTEAGLGAGCACWSRGRRCGCSAGRRGPA
ncbi:hypothetical protein ACFRDV_29435 [Streptomyces fagopyri]|uniref:hypothetical protein n=1 Tax=Streptomyces fagopyri TaxID=2662397 RepID=UPI00369F6660